MLCLPPAAQPRPDACKSCLLEWLTLMFRCFIPARSIRARGGVVINHASRLQLAWAYSERCLWFRFGEVQRGSAGSPLGPFWFVLCSQRFFAYFEFLRTLGTKNSVPIRLCYAGQAKRTLVIKPRQTPFQIARQPQR